MSKSDIRMTQKATYIGCPIIIDLLSFEDLLIASRLIRFNPLGLSISSVASRGYRLYSTQLYHKRKVSTSGRTPCYGDDHVNVCFLWYSGVIKSKGKTGLEMHLQYRKQKYGLLHII
jgi:hypothetical protein